MKKSNIVFDSKRNHCFYDAQKNSVMKEFACEESYLTEKDMLIKLKMNKEIRTPMLLAFNDQSLILELEYIKGELILEQLEAFEALDDINGAIQTLSALVTWLTKFYELTKGLDDQDMPVNLIYGDVNLRNFILSEGNVIGLDLEQCRLGNQVEELEYLLAMYRLYNPTDTAFKHKVCYEICQRHDIIMEHIEKQMVSIIKRRKSNI